MKSIVSANKPKKGRPSVDTEPVNLRLPRDLIAAIDKLRTETDGIPSRPEVVRSILRDWLHENGRLPK